MGIYSVKLPKGLMVQMVDGTVSLMGTGAQFKEALLAFPGCIDVNFKEKKGVQKVIAIETAMAQKKRGPKPKFNANEVKSIKAKYKKGASASAIAKEFGCCANTIYRYVRQ